MKIKITESQYKKIFLSGKYENILLEQNILKVVNSFLDDMSSISKYTTSKNATSNFAKDFSDNTLSKIEKSFGVGDGTINTFQDFKNLISKRTTPIDEKQFMSLLGVKNVELKKILLDSFSKDEDIHRILSLYNKAKTSDRSDIISSLRDRLKKYLGTDEEVTNFIDNYSKFVTTKAEHVGKYLDSDLKTLLKSLEDGEKFSKFKGEAERIIDNINLYGYDLFKDKQQYKNFMDAKSKFKQLIKSQENLKKFEDFLEKNKIDVDTLSEKIRQKNPNLLDKILVTNDKIFARSKSIGRFFLVILLIVVATTLGISVYGAYKFLSGVSSGKSTMSDELPEISQEVIKLIYNKGITNIIKDGENLVLSENDLNTNSKLTLNPSFKVSSKNSPEEGLFLITISDFLINGNLYKNLVLLYNQSEKTMKFVESGRVKTSSEMQLEIKIKEDKDNNYKIESFNTFLKDNKYDFLVTNQNIKFNLKNNDIYEPITTDIIKNENGEEIIGKDTPINVSIKFEGGKWVTIKND